MTLMIDSVTGSAPPLDSPIVAGYVDGPYGPNNAAAWTSAAWARYPHAQHVTITVRGAPGARAADCESGAMTIPSTVNWALNEIAARRRPTIYADLYDWSEASQSIDKALAKVGLVRGRDLDGWVAQVLKGASPLHPPVSPPLGFVAIQYFQDTLSTPLGSTGHAVDLSVTNGIWPGMAPPPPLTPTPNKEIRPMLAIRPDRSYWVCDPSGAVYSFGDAPYLGGTNPGAHTPMPAGHQATGFDATPSGNGYMISTDHGEVYTFGDAIYHGGPGPSAV